MLFAGFLLTLNFPFVSSLRRYPLTGPTAPKAADIAAWMSAAGKQDIELHTNPDECVPLSLAFFLLLFLLKGNLLELRIFICLMVFWVFFSF